jgi:hypothetical protein
VFEELKRASEKTGRRYWWDMFVGAVTQHLLGKGLDSEGMRKVWHIASRTVGAVLRFLLGGNGGGPTMLPPDIGTPV